MYTLKFFIALLFLGCQGEKLSFFWKSGEHYINRYLQFKDPCWKTMLDGFPNKCKLPVKDVPGVSSVIFTLLFFFTIQSFRGIWRWRCWDVSVKRKKIQQSGTALISLRKIAQLSKIVYPSTIKIHLTTS